MPPCHARIVGAACRKAWSHGRRRRGHDGLSTARAAFEAFPALPERGRQQGRASAVRPRPAPFLSGVPPGTGWGPPPAADAWRAVDARAWPRRTAGSAVVAVGRPWRVRCVCTESRLNPACPLPAPFRGPATTTPVFGTVDQRRPALLPGSTYPFVTPTTLRFTRTRQKHHGSRGRDQEPAGALFRKRRGSPPKRPGDVIHNRLLVSFSLGCKLFSVSPWSGPPAGREITAGEATRRNWAIDN